MSEFETRVFPSRRRRRGGVTIHLAAPIPAIIVEWPTGVFYGNHQICPCCKPSEAEGFVAFLPRSIEGLRWSDLCFATEEEAMALVEKAQESASHRLRNLEFLAHPGNRYCWHRCRFDLELWPDSLAFPAIKNGRFHGWLAWPWEVSSGYEPRPWGIGRT